MERINLFTSTYIEKGRKSLTLCSQYTQFRSHDYCELRFLFFLSALTLPCLAVLATVAVALAAILFYFMIYVLATPKVCLPFVALREIGR